MAHPRRIPSATRRALTAGALFAPAASLFAATPGGSSDATLDVWIHLSHPELASVPPADRDAARHRITQQQDTVMSALRDLGATEQARVQIVRNALAVRLPRAALAQARAIDGVRTVTPIRHPDLHRP